MYKINSINNKKGFTITEILVALGATAFVSLTAFTLLQNANTGVQKAEAFFWLNDLRQEVVRSFKDMPSTNNAILNTTNASMACLRNKLQNPTAISSCANQGGPVPVIYRKSQILLNNSNPQAGFDRKGVACTGFSLTNPNANCPFRYEVSWTPLCRGTDCNNPDIVVRGDLRVSIERSALDINPAPYSFSMLIPRSGETNLTSCEASQLGSFNAGSNRCGLNLATACPNGRYVVGFANDGTPNCQAVNPINSACPAGTQLRGVDVNGNAICTSLCI